MVNLPRLTPRTSQVRLVPLAHLRSMHRLLLCVIAVQLLNLAVNLARLYR
jgi:hypothetical protein